MGLFEHGHMQSVTYAYKVFNKHFEKVNPQPGFVSLELGPGDSLLSAILSKTAGGSASYLVDSDKFASDDLRIYQEMESFLQAKGLLEPVLTSKTSLEEICQNHSSQYLTSGLRSLQSLPSESIDFIWSQAVLEHIRKVDFLDTMRELRRVIRPNGTCSHVIDLKDHLGSALNNLRFSERVWESDFMANSGFYTNRIRYSEMMDMFRQAGFSVEVVDVKKRKLYLYLRRIGADKVILILKFSELRTAISISLKSQRMKLMKSKKDGFGYNERLFSGGLRKRLHFARFIFLVNSISRFDIDCDQCLELGCFDGKLIDFLPIPPSIYVGYDANWEGGLDIAFEKWKSHDNYFFRKSSVPSDIDLDPDFSASLTVAMETLEHIPPYLVDGYLKKLALYTKGFFIVTVPNEKGLFFLLKYTIRKFLTKDSYNYSFSELVNAVLGRMHKILRDNHKGFDYDDLIKQISKHFDILEISGHPYGFLPKNLCFGIGIVAKSKNYSG